MDNNTAQNNQADRVIDSDATKALQDILKGELPEVEKDDSRVIIESSKLSNDFAREIVKKFRDAGYDYEKIVELILTFDQQAEEGKLTQETIDKFIKSED